MIRHRNEFPQLIDSLGLHGIGVEVGTAEGDFAQVLLKSGLSQLYSVDNWCNPTEMNLRAKAYERASKEDRLTIIERDSKDAATFFDDGSLDFVYIDAQHQYKHVKEDLESWWPKVKVGGIMAGHDYCVWNPAAHCDCGVFLAVEEFFTNKATIYATNCFSSHYVNRLRTATLLPKDVGYQGDNLPSFWVIK